MPNYEKTVLIAGCGGLGGYLAEFCTRAGVKRIILVDGDCFDSSNRNRQLFCREDTFGRPKAAVVAEELNKIDASVEAVPVMAFLTAENAEELLRTADVALDALDNVPSRLLLEDACELLSIPLVHAAVEGLRAQVSTVLPGQRSLHLLYSDPDSQPPVETARTCVPPYCAAVQAQEALRLLEGRQGELAGKLWVSDLETLETGIFSLI